MTITSITLDEATFERLGIGLTRLPLNPPLRLRSLGSLVVLAGANGSGKSRFLDLLHRLMQKQLGKAALEDLARQRRQGFGQIESLERSLEGKKTGFDAETAEIALADSILSLEKIVDERRKADDRLALAIEGSSILEISFDEVPQIVAFVPRLPRLLDPSHAVEAEAGARATRLGNLGTDKSEQNAPAHARTILRAALRGRDDRRNRGLLELSPQEQAEAELVALVRDLVGEDMTPGLDDSLNLTLGRFRDYENALSDGQQVLFQFACLLHAQGVKLEGCIVLMDEPENHLHPAVLNQVIDRLRARLVKGQLWIATHSVPLVAHAVAREPDCLWYVEAGRIQHAGRSPEKVLEGLMGGAAGAQHLHDLTLLPAQYAAIRFLSECLSAPGVVGPDIKDPQTRQISTILQRRKAATGKVRVLDFGAGKARLLATMTALDPNARDWLDYYAFDPSSENEAERSRELAAVYGENGARRSFTDLDSLRARLDPNSVDAVVMCNVLHEVDPSQWGQLFGAGGTLTGLLSMEGVLLVVEDYGIPVGERAHRYGFLLLDEFELVKLFQIVESDRQQQRFLRETPDEARYRNRLVVHAIGSECVARYTARTRFDSIKVLNDRSLTSLDSILASGTGAIGSDGRSYARNAQLAANSAIWLKQNTLDT